MKFEIDHIIFDLGGVLLNIDLAKITTGFAQIMHASAEGQKKVKEEIIPSYETGKITTQEFLESLQPYLKPEYTLNDIVSIWNSIILDLPPERLLMLKELRKKYRVHLLSNINDLHANCFEENFKRWFNEDPRNYFDQFFYSHIIRKRKPDVETYTWVLDQLGADPEKAVFIDDMPENIEGARNAGINAYHLLNHKIDVIQLMKELKLMAA